MKHFNITFKPDGRKISIHAGATIFEAAAQAGIILNSPCGQKGTCKKCAVNIEPDSKLVLACQYHIQTDLTVTVPADSRLFEQKILAHGIETKHKVQHDIYKQYTQTASPEKILGLAVDIGSTTVVAKLINLTDGQCLATEASLNPQTEYGDDVVSRIAYAKTDTQLNQLHKAITDCINQLTEKLCRQTSTDPKHIYQICAVGNTTMNHLFLKLPVAQLGQAPYKTKYHR